MIISKLPNNHATDAKNSKSTACNEWRCTCENEYFLSPETCVFLSRYREKMNQRRWSGRRCLCVIGSPLLLLVQREHVCERRKSVLQVVGIECTSLPASSLSLVSLCDDVAGNYNILDRDFLCSHNKIFSHISDLVVTRHSNLTVARVQVHGDEQHQVTYEGEVGSHVRAKGGGIHRVRVR